MNPLWTIPASYELNIPEHSFYKNGFCIEQPTKVDMTLNKETQPII